MLRRNLLANYGGTLVLALAQILTLPWYLNALGEHQFGLLSILLAWSAALLTFEAGLAQAITRRFAYARSGASATALLSRLEGRYLPWVTGLTATLAAAAYLNPWASEGAAERAPLVTIAALMAGAMAVGSLYRSVLIARAAHGRLNVLLIGFTVVRHAVGLALAGSGWGAGGVGAAFAAALGAEALVRRQVAGRLLRAESVRAAVEAPSAAPAAHGGSAVLLAAAGAVGALGTQIDRLVLADRIEPAALGHYAIAATLSLAILQFVYPISNALLPRLRRFTAGSGTRREEFTASTAIIAAVLLLGWIALTALLAFGALAAWLHSPTIAAAVAPLLVLHLGGTTLNAFCVPFFLALLADHHDRRVFLAALLALTMQLLVLFALPHIGSVHPATSGALAWLSGNATLLAAYILMLRLR